MHDENVIRLLKSVGSIYPLEDFFDFTFSTKI